jgi:hypothetical protein
MKSMGAWGLFLVVLLGFCLVVLGVSVWRTYEAKPWARTSDCPDGQVEYFTPQPDITAYQTARVMAAVTLLGKAMVCVTAEHPLPEEFVKHFSPVPGQNSKPDAKP